MKKSALYMSITAFILTSVFAFILLIYRSYIHSGQTELFSIDYIRYLMDVKLEQWGQAGDYFGGLLNPVIGLAGSVLLFETYRTTKNQISASESDEHKRKIESIFFNLLKQHDNITSQLELNPHDLNFDIDTIKNVHFDNIKNTRNRLVFKCVFDILRFSNPKNQCTKTITTYQIIQDKYNYILGHYFRNMYQILKVLYDSEHLTEIDKITYSRIFRAQLSSYELIILMVNCLNKIVDNGEFRQLLIEYQILEHTPIIIEDNLVYAKGFSEPLITTELIKQYISPHACKENEFGAFGKNPAFIDNCGTE